MEAGKIQFYGMATWNGFRQEAHARDAMQLAEFASLAHDIAGEKHHFRFVQLPFNLGMTEALTLGNQSISGKDKTVMEAARELDITLVASASLLQGQVTRNLPPFVAEALGLENDAQRALQFVRSSPGITTALVGMANPEHVMRQHKTRRRRARHDRSIQQTLHSRRIRVEAWCGRYNNVFGSGSTDEASTVWSITFT